MRPYIYECDLEFDCPIKYTNYNFPLSNLEALSYQQEKEDFLNGKDKVSFLEVAQKFQHIYTLNQDKVLKLAELIQEIISRGEKVIIFIKFADEIRCLKECGILNFAYVGIFYFKNIIKNIKFVKFMNYNYNSLFFLQ